MKPIIFIAAGLLVGLAGGTFVGGTKERDAILLQMAEEEAAAEAEAAAEDEAAEDDGEGEGEGEGEDHAGGTDPAAPDSDHSAEDLPNSAAEAGARAADRNFGREDSPPPSEAGSNPAPTQDPGGDEAPTTGEDQAPSEGGNPEAAVSDPPSTPSTATPVAAESPFPGGQGPERLAKIFGAMEPADAARVLENLKDEEIRAILFHLSDRKVAAVLGEFDPARAATLSRTVLGPESGGGR